MLVVYGFHPEEQLAEEVGERLRGWNPKRVEAIRFRPSYMPDDIHRLPDKEGIRITLDGIKELKQFANGNYRFRCLLNLHETPILREIDNEQYGISFPAWNEKLRNVLSNFRDSYREKVSVVGKYPLGFPSYHSATVEYFSKVKRGENILTLSNEQGQRFTEDLIDYLMESYRTKSGGVQ